MLLESLEASGHGYMPVLKPTTLLLCFDQGRINLLDSQFFGSI
jgi:hypothetical protein